jgi:type II secretory pathway pseudopilin PulG
MVANVGTLTVRRQIGISLIEVITAIAILAVGIWAIVTLFPRGQDIIRRSGLRQQATQLAHEAISDFLADPAKMPFAIVPFNPADPQIANRPVCLSPLTSSPSAAPTTSSGANP